MADPSARLHQMAEDYIFDNVDSAPFLMKWMQNPHLWDALPFCHDVEVVVPGCALKHTPLRSMRLHGDRLFLANAHVIVLSYTVV